MKNTEKSLLHDVLLYIKLNLTWLWLMASMLPNYILWLLSLTLRQHGSVHVCHRYNNFSMLNDFNSMATLIVATTHSNVLLMSKNGQP